MTQDIKHESVLMVPDLAEAIDFFTGRLGFRIDMILPADEPRIALISGQGVTLRLETGGEKPDSADEDFETGFLISHLNNNDGWHVGRAGMQYRDLIPGRLGGRFAASHIRIPDGGEVPDYVHYHKVRFQMIFCRAGWVRVVYEDQGPPFVLEAGDCVLQPPGIRHRVLESSPGLEVIEIGSPAVHETWADHNLQLPTRQLSRERLFEGQRFVRHIAREAVWGPWLHEGFEARDTGISAATSGLASVRVVRTHSPIKASAAAHDGDLLFLFILRGGLRVLGPAPEVDHLQAGDSCLIPAGMEYTLLAGAGLEMLEISLPAKTADTLKFNIK